MSGEFNQQKKKRRRCKRGLRKRERNCTAWSCTNAVNMYWTYTQLYEMRYNYMRELNAEYIDSNDIVQWRKAMKEERRKKIALHVPISDRNANQIHSVVHALNPSLSHFHWIHTLYINSLNSLRICHLIKKKQQFAPVSIIIIKIKKNLLRNRLFAREIFMRFLRIQRNGIGFSN